jgi:hypothetical protein
MVGLIVAIGFAVLFHRMAAYERLSPWMWAAASFALSMVVLLVMGFAPVLFAQVALYGVMWWYNARKGGRREQDWAARREEQHHIEEERWRRAQEEIQRDRKRRER